MFDLIVACTQSCGIGFNDKIPWCQPEDLKIFKTVTQDSILIMGRVTVESLPLLKNRTIICISRNKVLKQDKNNSIICDSIDFALEYCMNHFPTKNIIIAGGAQIYNEILKNYSHLLNVIHISMIKEEALCDTFIDDVNLKEFSILEVKNYTGFVYMKYQNGKYYERYYLDLLKKVAENGSIKNGRNGETKSLFGENLKFNLLDGFPLLTTKKMFFRGIVEELLFFLRGDTDSKVLEDKKINIWKGNTERTFLDNNNMKDRKEGMMGPLYGYQWRHFNAKYDENTGKNLEQGIDQLENVVQLLRTDPNSRRILLTDYNPLQASQGVLYPCHSIIIQFYVDDGYLDMFCYNRSQDLFLGVPFNIASSALLLTIIAKLTNLTARHLNISMGDCHIYKQHYCIISQQISRDCKVFPQLKINAELKNLKDIENLNFEDFILENYISHPAIKAEMIA